MRAADEKQCVAVQNGDIVQEDILGLCEGRGQSVMSRGSISKDYNAEGATRRQLVLCLLLHKIQFVDYFKQLGSFGGFNLESLRPRVKNED